MNTLLEKFFLFHSTIDVTGNFLWDLSIECLGTGDRFDWVIIGNNQLIFAGAITGNVVVYTNNQWVNDAYKDVFVSGGPDVEDGNAYNWFTMNADNYVPTYNITYNLQHVTAINHGGGVAPTSVSYNGSIALQLIPDTDYGLPSTVRISGDCVDTYLPRNKTLFLDNVKSDVSITIIGVFHRVYDINMTLEHLTYTGDTTVETGGTASGALIPSAAYFLPETVEVTGCSYTYDKNTGAITFSNPPHSSTGVYLTATGTPIDTSSLTLILYNNQAERIQANKIPKLSVVGVVRGTLREQSSIIKPSISMEYDHVPDFNYVYIPNFSRYYYVNNITSVSKNIWRIDLSVDVLMSYYTAYRELTGIVKRQENSYNNFIIDDRRPFTAKQNISIIEASGTSNITISQGVARYIITCLTGGTYTTGTTFRKSFNPNSKLLYTEANFELITEQLNGSSFANDVGNMFTNTPSEAIISLKAYPFDLATAFNVTEYTDDTYFGGYHSSIKCKKVSSSADKQRYFDGGTFTVSPSDWRDYMSNYSLFVPFAGYIDLTPSEIFGKKIWVRYGVDFDTGGATVLIYSTATNAAQPYAKELIRTTNCMISVDIAMSQTNGQEIARNILTSTASLAVGMATGGVGLAMGVTGALNMATSLIPRISRTGASGGAWTSILTGTTSFIIKTTPDYITPTNYGHLHGYPSMQTAQLKTLTGYTVMDEIHVEDIPNITEAEQTELETVLKSGFIM